MSDNNNIQEINFTLNIQSNVSYPVNISVLGNPFNPLDTSNATTQYRYDFTGFTFTNENSITLEYRQSSASVFSTFVTTFTTPNINSVVSALNGLGIGSFYTYTQSGSTYISTYNQNYVFGLLNVFNPASILAPPSAILKAEMSGTVGQVQYFVNAGSSILNPPPFDVSFPLPVTATTDTIKIQGIASNASSKKVAYIINLTTGVTVYYVNLNVGDTFNSGNITVGNNSWEMGYMDF